jgi:hypothetical protein
VILREDEILAVLRLTQPVRLALTRIQTLTRNTRRKRIMAKKSPTARRRAPPSSGGEQARRRGQGDPRPQGAQRRLEKKFGAPNITKDGVTVAKEIELEDPLENMGAQMVREVASKTSDVAGDGTTTATVLAQAIYREGSKNVTAGANPMALKRGIDLAVKAVVEAIDDLQAGRGQRHRPRRHDLGEQR